MPVLGCLKIPGLRVLTVELPGTSPITDISPFISSLSRSSAHLLALTLSYLPATKSDLIECLKVTTSLATLTIEPTPSIDCLNSLFSQLTGLPDFLPNLEFLHVIFPSNLISERPHIKVPVLLRMLYWRWAAVGIAQMQHFRLAHSYGELPFEKALRSNSKFRRLQAKGMMLYIGKKESVDMDFV
ncbi:hypothetical protein DFH06DRAFT_1313894 [Mycena polygramma]|nr:hypothetical protein DFH06DRAFT_1313894 [Mycena polygramma]